MFRGFGLTSLPHTHVFRCAPLCSPMVSYGTFQCYPKFS